MQYPGRAKWKEGRYWKTYVTHGGFAAALVRACPENATSVLYEQRCGFLATGVGELSGGLSQHFCRSTRAATLSGRSRTSVVSEELLQVGQPAGLTQP
jgi:hypothetical protein